MSETLNKFRQNVEQQILNLLQDREIRPIELFEKFQSSEISDSLLKDALANLVSSGLVELSSDRFIRLRNGSLSTAR